MPIMTELIVSIVGGVLTALILSLFSGGRTRGPQTAAAVPTDTTPHRHRSAVGDFFRMIIAVACGIAIAMIAGRMLIEAGLVPRGLTTRLVLLVAGTALCWLLLVGLRRR